MVLETGAGLRSKFGSHSLATLNVAARDERNVTQEATELGGTLMSIRGKE